MAYDVIIVGARVAGSATALLLARQGARVLLLDQARFPSDTLSTHQVQLPAVARLRRWGLLEAVKASNAVPTRTVRFDPGPVVRHGSFPAHEGVDALYSPRRYILDQILLDAAREAGAEVVERFAVEDLLRDSGRVVGITGRAKGAARSERAPLVIGADGKHSTVTPRRSSDQALDPGAERRGVHLLVRPSGQWRRDVQPTASRHRRMADERRPRHDLHRRPWRRVRRIPPRPRGERSQHVR